MSTVAYAQLTNFRDQSAPSTSVNGANGAPGIKTYSDALSALVPAEMLTVHALVIAMTTKKSDPAPGAKDVVSVIIDSSTLTWAFYLMCFLSVLLYVVPRLTAGLWDKFDLIRMTIPALAFVGWTMLQPTSAFDAVYGELSLAQRTVSATFLAIVLGLLANSLAYKADAKSK